jgi:hypothetical protein
MFEDIEKICLFLGCNRSGSSLVRSILNAHPDVLISHETGRDSCYIKMFNNQISKQEVLKNFYNNAINHSATSQRVYYNFQTKEMKTGVYDNTIKGHFQGKVDVLRVLGDKSGPWLCDMGYEFDKIHERLEDFFEKKVYYIHPIRHPFSNLLSIYGASESYGNFFKWSDGTKKTLEYLPKERVFNVPLEHLVERRGDFVKEIFDFLEVKTDEKLTTDISKVIFKEVNNKKYKEILTEDQIKNFKDMIKKYEWYDIYNIGD